MTTQILTPRQPSRPERYDPVSQTLHWFVAIMVIAIYAIGIVREELPKGDFRSWLLTVHMSLGMLVMALTFARLGWRSFNPAPAPVPAPKMASLAAKAAHLALYVALLALPIIGLFAAWAKGRDLTFFALFPIPSPIGVDRGLAKTLENAHELAAHLMMLLVGVHAFAAIAHQYVLKDGTLQRMLPQFGKSNMPARG
jgi:cytochrome b561